MGNAGVTDIAEYTSRYLMPKVKDQTSDCVRYYRAYVTAAASNGKITVKRPFDNETQRLAYTPKMENAKVGDQVTVFSFGNSGNAQNCVIVDNGSFSEQDEVLSSITDYIVSQGTSGNWTYRVWKSGHREAWGYYDVPYVNSNVFWGSISLPGSGYRYTFATLTDYGSNASTALKWNVKAYCSSAGNAARVYVHRPDGGGTSGSTMRVYLYAFG